MPNVNNVFRPVKPILYGIRKTQHPYRPYNHRIANIQPRHIRMNKLSQSRNMQLEHPLLLRNPLQLHIIHIILSKLLSQSPPLSNQPIAKMQRVIPRRKRLQRSLRSQNRGIESVPRNLDRSE